MWQDLLILAYGLKGHPFLTILELVFLTPVSGAVAAADAPQCTRIMESFRTFFGVDAFLATLLHLAEERGPSYRSEGWGTGFLFEGQIVVVLEDVDWFGVHFKAGVGGLLQLDDLQGMVSPHLSGLEVGASGEEGRTGLHGWTEESGL